MRALLGRSLAAIRDSVAPQYHAIAAALGAYVVQLQIDQEIFSVSANRGEPCIGPAAPSAPVRLVTASPAITALIDGELDLTDAVLAERIQVYGSVSQLSSFNDALSAYLHGVVRSAGQEEILHDFKLLARARGEGRN